VIGDASLRQEPTHSITEAPAVQQTLWTCIFGVEGGRTQVSGGSRCADSCTTPKLLPHRSRMGKQQRHFLHLHRVHARLVIPIRSRLVTMQDHRQSAFLNALLGMRVKDITWKIRVRSLRFACNLRDSKRWRIRASSSRAKAANPEEVRVLLGTRRA